MRELFWIGCVALLFGLASYRVLGELGLFNGANLVVGVAALGLAIAGGARRFAHSVAASGAGATLARPLATALLTSALAVGIVVASAAAGWRFDWTFEERFALSPATLAACEALEGPNRFSLYFDTGDPRIRNTRILLQEIARPCAAEVRQRDLERFPEEVDHYGIGSSNSVVIESGDRWELVPRPTEGALFEALSLLADTPRRPILYVTVGAGEGDLERSDELGYSGLRAALETEGYELRPLPSAVITRIPEDADALLVLAPERPLMPNAIAAIDAYLAGGGSLVVCLEPGLRGGLEPLLAKWGIESPEAILVDPASGPVDGDTPGLSPIAYNYSEHPVTQGLNRNRQTFFRRTRSFKLTKPQTLDRLRRVVHASGHSWLSPEIPPVGAAAPPERPAGARDDYHPIAVTGRYERGDGETRIVAFGDRDFVSNRYLRSLFNLDLWTNAVHWSVRREPDITLRPKVSQLIQFPVPLQQSIQALYGVGLLVPELLLILAGWMWLRARGA